MPITKPAGLAALRVRTDSIQAAMSNRNIPNYSALAVELKVPKATLHRVMTAQCQPGPAVIAAIKLRLGIPYDFILEAYEVDAA